MQHSEEHDSPLLDNVVKFVAGFIVLQAFHSTPFTFPIGFAELPNKYLEEGTDEAVARATEYLLRGGRIHGAGVFSVPSVWSQPCAYAIRPLSPTSAHTAHSMEPQTHDNDQRWPRGPSDEQLLLTPH